MIKLLKNPFYIYILGFITAFLLYGLGWSRVYPRLSISLYLFFFITFCICAVFGLITQKMKFIQYKKIELDSMMKGKIFVSIILIGHLIEGIYSGGFPLQKILFGAGGEDYRDHGIKVFHVFLITFNSFTIVYFYHWYLSVKKQQILLFLIIILIPPILIVNRGMFLIGLISIFFVYIQSKTRFLSFKQLSYLLIIVLGITFLFGLLGNFRSAHGDKYYLPKESKATESFLKSPIPKEYYWTYLYGASPLANFQKTVNKVEKAEYKMFQLFTFEVLPDFISKRVASGLDMTELQHYKIRPWLTVGGIYANPYMYAKWLGPILIFIYLIFFILFIITLIPKRSNYHVTVIAILSTMMLMNTFDNMLTFSGLVLQLIYPIFFRIFEIKIKTKNV